MVRGTEMTPSVKRDVRALSQGVPHVLGLMKKDLSQQTLKGSTPCDSSTRAIQFKIGDYGKPFWLLQVEINSKQKIGFRKVYFTP